MTLHRNGGHVGGELRAQRGIGDGFTGDFFTELVADLVGLVRELGVGHQRDHHDRDEQTHQTGEAHAPGAEDAGHLLLVGGAAAIAGVVADPAGAVENLADDAHRQREDVKVAQFLDIEGIEEILAVHAVHHNGCDGIAPREVVENVARDDDEDRVADQTLKGVGDEQGNAAGRPDDDHAHRQHETDDDREGRHRDAEDHDLVRKPEEIDEEVGGDRRADRVGEHLGQRAQRGGDDAKRAVVTHLQELADGERTRFTKAVGAVAGEAHDDAHGDDHVFPKRERVADLVFGFDERDERDDAETGGHVTDRDHVAAGHAARGEEVHDTPHVFLGVDGQPEN